MFSPFSVANCIIETFKKETNGQNITILALLKYVLFCYGWYLAMHDKELFKGKFYTCPLGPLMFEIYWGFDDSHKEALRVIKLYNINETLPSDVQDFVSYIIQQYRNHTALELSEITHFPKSPWEQVVTTKGLYEEIPLKIIRKYYKLLLKDKRLY